METSRSPSEARSSSSNPGIVATTCGIDRDEAVLVLAAVEPDHVEPAVLAANQQMVLDHERRAVPVVVAQGLGHARAPVDAPQRLWRLSIEGHDAQVPVARAGVVEREAVGVGRGRTLREVERDERRTDGLARVAVDEVIAPVVGALAYLDAPAGQLDHVRLPRPAGAAPFAGVHAHDRGRAQLRPLRVLPSNDRIERHGSHAVVRAGRVAAEGGEPVEGRGSQASACGPRPAPARRRPWCRCRRRHGSARVRRRGPAAPMPRRRRRRWCGARGAVHGVRPSCANAIGGALRGRALRPGRRPRG